MTRVTELSISQLGQLGEPIPMGMAAPCRYCASSRLVWGKCHRYVGKDSLRQVPVHLHVCCGDCKAQGPSVKLGAGSKEFAIWAWSLYAPSPGLVDHLWNKDLRKMWSGKPYRHGRRSPVCEPCSFCGSTVVSMFETGVLSYRMYALCEHCYAEGPWAVNRNDARFLWNQAYEVEKKWVSGFRLKPDKEQLKSAD
jgi:hypothetical protein